MASALFELACDGQPNGQGLLLESEYLIVNAKNRCVLLPRPLECRTAGDRGHLDLDSLLAGPSMARINNAFRLHSVPHPPPPQGQWYYIEACDPSLACTVLDTHGGDALRLFHRGRTIAEMRAGNTSASAGNIRWIVIPCPHRTPHDPPTFYIVNARHRTFLDSHGRAISLWNGGAAGMDVEAIIAANTSVHAANIRWQFFNLHKAFLLRTLLYRSPARRLALVHISDTHMFHDQLEVPPGDVLLHTGDMTLQGTDAQFAGFDAFLGRMRAQFKYIVVIAGNHEWESTTRDSADPDAVVSAKPSFLKRQLTRATHVLEHEMVDLDGVKIYGKTWDPWLWPSHPGEEITTNPQRQRFFEAQQKVAPCAYHRVNDVPAGMDILMTHEPAAELLDFTGRSCWGSSAVLRAQICNVKPRVHLFGHVHEQRGAYFKLPDGTYDGGVEYALPDGSIHPTKAVPPETYPCQLVCNSAMVDQPTSRLVGTPRCITATMSTGGWHFALS